MHFFTKNGTCVKKKIRKGHSMPVQLILQAFVATTMELKARDGIIFRNCDKSNDNS